MPFHPDKWLDAVKAAGLPKFLTRRTAVALVKMQKAGRVAERIDAIAEEADVSRNSVLRHFEKLKACGLVEWTNEPGYENEYHLKMPES